MIFRSYLLVYCSVVILVSSVNLVLVSILLSWSLIEFKLSASTMTMNNTSGNPSHKIVSRFVSFKAVLMIYQL